MDLDVTEVNIQKKMSKRMERVEAAKEINKDTYFYYLRDDKRQIFGGVCLKKVDGVWCRGISLWSDNGPFNADKKTIKKWARSRLIKAIMTKKDNDLSNVIACNGRRVSKKLSKFYPSFFIDDYGFKSRYNAHLTVAEKRTVGE
jgi:hypothetical protein